LDFYDVEEGGYPCCGAGTARLLSMSKEQSKGMWVCLENDIFYIMHYASGEIMTKTVAVREETWERMKKLLEAGDAKSFDELIRKLIDHSLQVPRSMFGVDRNRKVQLTVREHEEITRDAH
jgi:predicted CopG family antitoxin